MLCNITLLGTKGQTFDESNIITKDTKGHEL